MIDASKIAEDALYFRKVPEYSHCIVHNVAAKDLLAYGCEALPAIEDIVCRVVSPQLDESTDNNMLGLTSLLGAYLLIGVEYDNERMIRFVNSTSEKVREEFLAAIPAYFTRNLREGFPQKLLSPELKYFIETSILSSNKHISRLAVRASEFLF